MALTKGLPIGAVGDFFALPVSDYVEAVVLSANTAVGVTPPANAKYILISATGNFFMRQSAAGTAATVPGATTTDGSANELNPIMRLLSQGQLLSFIASAAQTLTLSYFA